MKMQIRLVVFAACVAALAPVGAVTAQARECSVVRPSDAKGYWSWRLIDGRKCWYAGKTMISKSLLQWSAKPAAQQPPARQPPVLAKAEAPPVSVATEKRSDPRDAQARMLDYANSFEMRWRARAISD